MAGKTPLNEFNMNWITSMIAKMNQQNDYQNDYRNVITTEAFCLILVRIEDIFTAVSFSAQVVVSLL